LCIFSTFFSFSLSPLVGSGCVFKSNKTRKEEEKQKPFFFKGKKRRWLFGLAVIGHERLKGFPLFQPFLHSYVALFPCLLREKKNSPCQQELLEMHQGYMPVFDIDLSRPKKLDGSVE
jgi:hypothetical protein